MNIKRAIQLHGNELEKTYRELNRFSERYPIHELQAFKGDPISLEEAKQKYPNAKLYDIIKDDIYDFPNIYYAKKDVTERWEEIVLILDKYVVAYVDLNKYFFPKKGITKFGATPIFTVFWYASEFSTQTIREQSTGGIVETCVDFLKNTMNMAESIRNFLASIYPEKNYTYVPQCPLTQLEYTLLKRFIKSRVAWCKIRPVYNEEKKISKVQVKIDVELSADELKRNFLNYLKEKKKNATSVVPSKYFVNLPEKGRIDQEIPFVVLHKNFSQKSDLLCTLFYYVDSIKWLYKFSETTTSLLGNSEVNEIHILLIELNDVICNRSNRKMNQESYCYVYYYGIEFATESKFLEYLDSIIPYQTICIFKINRDKSFPLYQIWSGKKSITMKGSKVKKYVHTDWMYEEELVRKPLEFNGKSLSEVFSSFLLQIDGNGKE